MISETHLRNKKILFVGPVFHHYHRVIIDALTELGAHVDFFAEREYSLRFKFINNYLNKRLQHFQSDHYRKIIKEIRPDSYDYLFVIRGYMMTEEFIAEFKKLNPSARTIMYQWDSERANPFFHLVPAFDKVFSFDFEDCRNNAALTYQPLFYTKDIEDNMIAAGETAYTYLFMGVYFPQRYKAVVMFKKYASAHQQKIKTYIYLPFTTYIKEKLKGVKFDHSIVSFRHLKRQSYLSLLKQSEIIVDVSNEKQTGLAMRIIEALASDKKVLTNNPFIANDPTYGDSIAVFNSDSPSVSDEFLNSKPRSKRNSILSVNNWIINLFLTK